ncbi:hypothetical protein [Winogradskya humida]|uniref:Uncharacterized protein n=1 Tax=Winogradskya humida TaxID=113566 RepID=A0ABQ4A3M5_9ACTN|nr:hypothetical protein [Actinoplanes humidus]GIE24952.1 hypothetical protein Ahu01nite_080540 [Actinoplanes humidus]
MADGDGRRWLPGVAGLPMPLVVFLLGYRLHEESWSEAVNREATAPLLLLPLAVYLRYAARTGPVVPARTALRWLGSGALLCISAVGVDLISLRWVEAILDGIVLVLGASFLGDAFRSLTRNRVHAPIGESPR